MELCPAVENIVCLAGCQVGSLPDLSLEAAPVCALDLVFEDSWVAFLLRVVVVEMFRQGVLDVLPLNVDLVIL